MADLVQAFADEADALASWLNGRDLRWSIERTGDSVKLTAGRAAMAAGDWYGEAIDIVLTLDAAHGSIAFKMTRSVTGNVMEYSPTTSHDAVFADAASAFAALKAQF